MNVNGCFVPMADVRTFQVVVHRFFCITNLE